MMPSPSCEAIITQPSRGNLRIVQIGVLNRRTGARRLRDERGVMGVVRGNDWAPQKVVVPKARAFCGKARRLPKAARGRYRPRARYQAARRSARVGVPHPLNVFLQRNVPVYQSRSSNRYMLLSVPALLYKMRQKNIRHALAGRDCSGTRHPPPSIKCVKKKKPPVQSTKSPFYGIL